ncbi:MAG: ABC transporter permease [Candidatus Brockarchaeota archaeon]|nr:ABC transporter permease [Candidatus Brockarchaeota archaeon]
MKTKELIGFLRKEREDAKEAGVLEKVAAFVARDFKTWWTYKLWVTIDVLGTLTFVASYYFVSKIISPEILVEAGYGSDYLTFAVIGVAFQQYVFSSVSTLSESIRSEQWDGTMETILSSRTSFRVFLLGESVFRFIIGSYFLLAALALGAAIGVKITANPWSLLSAALVAALLVVSHMIVGILGAALILKVKQGDPIVWAFSWLTQLFSGVLYPLNLLPAQLSWIGAIFPLTYSLDGIRRCLMADATILSPIVAEDVVKLVVFIAASLPIALKAFRKAYDSTRKDGSLGQY